MRRSVWIFVAFAMAVAGGLAAWMLRAGEEPQGASTAAPPALPAPRSLRADPETAPAPLVAAVAVDAADSGGDPDGVLRLWVRYRTSEDAEDPESFSTPPAPVHVLVTAEATFSEPEPDDPEEKTDEPASGPAAPLMRRVLTDRNGRAELSLPAGSYLVAVDEEGFYADSVEAEVDPEETGTSEITLVAQSGGVLSLTLHDSRGNRVEGSIELDEGAAFDVTRQGARLHLPLGEHAASVSAEGFLPARLELDLRRGQVVERDVVLESGASLEVAYACEGFSVGCPGPVCAGVSLEEWDGGVDPRAVDCTAGKKRREETRSISFTGLPSGPFEVRVTAGEGASALAGRSEVQTEPGVKREVNVRLEPIAGDAVLSGRVVLSDGGTLAAALVLDCDNGARYLGRSGDVGVFRIEHLKPGRCRLHTTGPPRMGGARCLLQRFVNVPDDLELRVDARTCWRR